MRGRQVSRNPAARDGRRHKQMTNAEGTAHDLRWRKDVAEHDYAAASSYLSIRYGESRAEEGSKQLRKLPVIQLRANDILRATPRQPLPLSDPGVLRDLQKVLAAEKLSPVLISEGDIADGYHRVSLAYALDPFADVAPQPRLGARHGICPTPGGH